MQVVVIRMVVHCAIAHVCLPAEERSHTHISTIYQQATYVITILNIIMFLISMLIICHIISLPIYMIIVFHRGKYRYTWYTRHPQIYMRVWDMNKCEIKCINSELIMHEIDIYSLSIMNIIYYYTYILVRGLMFN